jgi:hypothetical protein
MKSTQAWGWLAAGVMALGLNGFYQDGGAAWAHRIVNGVVEQVADRSAALADMASERVDRFRERANLLVARDETASCRLAGAVARFQTRMAQTRMTQTRMAQTTMAQTQTGMAHFEAMSARQEAVLARVEADRARIEAQVARVSFAPAPFNMVEMPVVACPRVRVNVPRVRIPRLPVVRMAAPVVQVDLGGGPI